MIKEKFTKIFLPFFIIQIGSLFGYTLLHWLLIIKFKLFSFDETTTTIGIPGVLLGILTFSIIVPRLEYLKLKVKHGDWTPFYIIVAWCLLFFPISITQNYLLTATGELMQLDSIQEIHKCRVGLGNFPQNLSRNRT